MQFHQDDNRKGTQRTQRQELMVFFLCDLCVLCGQFSLVAALPRWTFAPFRGKSTEVPFHEPFTRLG
jgi:hypothetical protein